MYVQQFNPACQLFRDVTDLSNVTSRRFGFVRLARGGWNEATYKTENDCDPREHPGAVAGGF